MWKWRRSWNYNGYRVRLLVCWIRKIERLKYSSFSVNLQSKQSCCSNSRYSHVPKDDRCKVSLHSTRKCMKNIFYKNSILAHSVKVKTKAQPHIPGGTKEFSKQLSLTRSLTAFLNMCVISNSTGRGWSILLNYRSSCKLSKTKRNIADIELYNILLSSYAGKANHRKIVEICKVIDEDSIPYTPQTYAAIFECLGRMSTSRENHKLLLKYKEDAESKVGINKRGESHYTFFWDICEYLHLFGKVAKYKILAKKEIE